MLTYESLLEQAKLRDIPANKIRGILREYLQILILKELYREKNGRNLCFTGGTYLRLVHNIRRFSEDLDFNTANLTRKEFETVIHNVQVGLNRFNAKVNLDFHHWDNMYVAYLTFSEVEKDYTAISRYSNKKGIVIKIETNNPIWEIKTEILLISGFGEMYPVVCTYIGALFADKIDAFIQKNRARHLYDIIFMLSQNHPIDQNVINAIGLGSDPLSLIAKKVKNFTTTQLKHLAEELRPFLFDENETELLINAHTIIPQLISRYHPKNLV